MRLTTLLRLHTVGGLALVAAAPGYAQVAPAISTTDSELLSVRVIATTAAKRATNLQRQPIAVNLSNGFALQDRSKPSVRTAFAAASLNQAGN